MLKTGRNAPIKYFEDPSAYKIKFVNGKLLNNDGTFLDTKSYKDPETRVHWGIYVASVNGFLYVGNALGREEKLYHSSFLQGQPVMCAGNIKVFDGEIQEITPRSGHYRPDNKHLVKFLELLEKNGVDLSKVQISDKTYKQLNALDFLYKEKKINPGTKEAYTFVRERLVKYSVETAIASTANPSSLGAFSSTFVNYGSIIKQLLAKDKYKTFDDKDTINDFIFELREKVDTENKNISGELRTILISTEFLTGVKFFTLNILTL